jgi:predicted dienelactone hydrolase
MRQACFITTFAIVLASSLACSSTTSSAPAQAADPRAYSAATQYRIEVRDAKWTDAARNRTLPVTIIAPDPQALAGPLPVVILSHGLGGSKDISLHFLAKHLAWAGYICILPTHVGSDQDAYLAGGREAMLKAYANPENLVNRPGDISFIIDRLTGGKENDPLLKGRVDAKRIGVAGHSFGAYTALAVGGQTIELPSQGVKGFRDPRVNAVLAMSPQKPGNIGLTRDSWNKIAVPTMTMTGTLDMGIGVTRPQDRKFAYDHMPAGDKYHVVIQGGTHMSFTDTPLEIRGITVDAQTAARHQEWICQLSLAFFDAHVRGDAKARKWLQDAQIVKLSGNQCKLDQK